MKTSIASLVLFLSLLLGTASAEQYKLGSKVKPFAANDQHGKAFKLDDSTRFLLLTNDMATGKLANTALDAKGAPYLPSQKAVYVANIHGMPAIGRMFAFKKMQKYSHRIIYRDDKDLMTPFPFHPAHVTVLRLDGNGKITRISYWDPAKQDIEKHLK